jgi:hypothetical protein
MAANLKVGDLVLVPSRRVGRGDYAWALLATKVVDVDKRSVVVDVPGVGRSPKIPTSKVHRELGVLIIVLGDFNSEIALLDPLAKSALQYCRLLLPDDRIRQVKIRSLEELRRFWAANEPAFTHIVLIGHGRKDAIACAVDEWMPPKTLCSALTSQRPKIFISLCCESGNAAFAKEFSKQSVCSSLIAPLHAVHGAVASQFVQTMLAHAFLNGETTAVAFRHAREAVPDSSGFRLWRRGVKAKGASR